MSDTVLVCPECDTGGLGYSGENYWCPSCSTLFPREEAIEREPERDDYTAPAKGLAAKLAKTDPSEVGR